MRENWKINAHSAGPTEKEILSIDAKGLDLGFQFLFTLPKKTSISLT